MKKSLWAKIVFTTMFMVLVSISLYAQNNTSEVKVSLRLLETTDIHVNIVDYDYYKDTTTTKFGLVRTATLIREARDEVTNSLLFDNGDLIQGNPLGDYMARVKKLKKGFVHPVYKAMNLLNYDAGNIGNHEFNYGLPFLQETLTGANFPYVNSNVYIDDGDTNSKNDKNYFTPYIILDRKLKDANNKEHSIRIGVIGFVPPQIMLWDKTNLTDKVITKDIVQSAKRFVPMMKKEGADIIVAIPHSGIGSIKKSKMEANAVYFLTKVKDIDAVLFGHSHSVFPSDIYKDLPKVDIEKGTINNVASVMPGYWGSHLGIIDLDLMLKNNKWSVTNAKASVRALIDKDKKPTVSPQKDILQSVQTEHNETLKYVRAAVGKTSAPITSYFAQVIDDPSVQIVNNAQIWYVKNYIKGTEYENLPVLSAAAPFKAGTRGDVGYYTDIPTGTLAIKNVSDLYLYPNTLRAVKLNGAEVKEWLEMSAGQFNQVDVNKTTEQEFLNSDFRSYNFDVIDGVTYLIDVTQAARYDRRGKLINAKSERIKNLSFEGKPIDMKKMFIVATNNYRAGGGGSFPGLGDSKTIIESPDENRQIIINYILEKKIINPSADNNWNFAPYTTKGDITFTTSPKAKKYIKTKPVAFLRNLESGFDLYKIEFK